MMNFLRHKHNEASKLNDETDLGAYVLFFYRTTDSRKELTWCAKA